MISCRSPRHGCKFYERGCQTILSTFWGFHSLSASLDRSQSFSISYLRKILTVKLARLRIPQLSMCGNLPKWIQTNSKWNLKFMNPSQWVVSNGWKVVKYGHIMRQEGRWTTMSFNFYQWRHRCHTPECGIPSIFHTITNLEACVKKVFKFGTKLLRNKQAFFLSENYCVFCLWYGVFGMSYIIWCILG